MSPASAIHNLGVVGGGQMGQGIGQVAAQAGLAVTLVDVSPELAAAAVAKLGKTLDRLVTKGKLAADERDATMARLRAGTGHADLGDCDHLYYIAACSHDPTVLAPLHGLIVADRDERLAREAAEVESARHADRERSHAKALEIRDGVGRVRQ